MNNLSFEETLTFLVNLENTKEEAIIKDAFPEMPEVMQNNLIEVLKAYRERGNDLTQTLFYFMKNNLDADQRAEFELYVKGNG